MGGKLIDDGYLRLNQIIGGESPIIPVSRNTWMQGVRDGEYPKPVHLSERIIAWKSSDIKELIEKINREKSNGRG